MADKKKINIDLDFTSNIDELLKRMGDLYQKIDSGGGFAGKEGTKRKGTIDRHQAAINEMLPNIGSSRSSRKEVGRLIFDVIKTYKEAASKITIVTEDWVRLQALVDYYTNRLSQLADERAEILSKGTVNQQGTVFTSLHDQTHALLNAGIFKKNKDGSASKVQIKTVDTLMKYANDPQLLTSANVSIEQFIQQVKDAFEKHNIALRDVNLEIATANEARDDSSLRLKQAGSDVSVNDPFVEASNLGVDASDIFSKYKTEQAMKAATIKQTQDLTVATEKQSTALQKSFKQFTIFALGMRLAKQAMREVVATIKLLDQSLTEQAMVTGLTRQQTYGLIQDYQDLALQAGSTTKEIAEVATEYLKQGKTIEDAKTLTLAAVSAAKVARVSVGDSVNYLTTALNGFQLSAEEAMLVSDKFAAVAAASASDYDELAIALSKVASQANLAGMSIDYTTALLTKGLETTREAPETMGTALKTIIARMRELSDYGKTLEDGTDINKVESQLAYVGIALRDQNGELRSTELVLDELGKKWDSLNKNQQAALAKALAGTRQQSRLIALMDDYERVTELQQISLRSAGATSAQASTYLEGIQASLNRIQVAWESVITSVSNSELIISVLDMFANGVASLATFMESGAGLPILLTGIAVIMTKIVSRKIIENNLAKDQLRLQKLQTIEALRQQAEARKAIVLGEQEVKIEQANADLKEAQARYAKAENQFKRNQSVKAEAEMAAAKQAEAEATVALSQAKAQGLQTDAEYLNITKQLSLAEGSLNSVMNVSMTLMSASIIIQGLYNVSKKVGTFVTGLLSAETRKATFAQ